jgi:hypothetical protein
MSDPQNIDQVIEQLNQIIDQALRDQQRIGYFTALYERVTTNVRRAIVAGNVFEDNARMEKLDVVFATRFLTAWGQHINGEQPTASWQVAFDILGDDQPLIIQHLLVGMNAHINLDLGIAAATIAPSPEQLQSLWPDFKQINAVLARLTSVVEVELGQVSPRLGHLEDFAPGFEGKIFDFGIDVARDYAWALANQLAAASPDGWNEIINQRDTEVALVGKALYPLSGIAGGIARWIREKESNDISYNIQIVGE